MYVYRDKEIRRGARCLSLDVCSYYVREMILAAACLLVLSKQDATRRDIENPLVKAIVCM